MMTRRAPPALSLAVALLLSSLAFAGEQSEVVGLARPKGGEYFGLYLLDKKVGYIFTDFRPVAGKPGQVESVNDLVFKATVGTQTSERFHHEVRIYEAKPNGRLLSFLVEEKGDGGDQRARGHRRPRPG